MLREHKTLFWIDSSIRFKETLDSIRNQTVNESRGILLFDYTGHSIFAATHKTMYKYLPMSVSSAINVSMMGANAIYIHCSKQVIMCFIYHCSKQVWAHQMITVSLKQSAEFCRQNVTYSLLRDMLIHHKLLLKYSAHCSSLQFQKAEVEVKTSIYNSWIGSTSKVRVLYIR